MSTQDSRTTSTPRRGQCGSSWITRSAASGGTSALPIKLSDSPGRLERSPLLGEHTDRFQEVLGYDETKIAG